MMGVFDDGYYGLGGGYKYYHVGVPFISGPQIDIPPFIANYNYDKRFIIVKQVLDGLPERNFYERYDYNYPSIRGDFYWIIDKQSHVYYGPLSIDEFIEKCDSLNVKIELSQDDKYKQ